MLLVVEKEIRGGMCHAIHKYAEVNNKYMKNYDKNSISSYLEYLDANNLYGWRMSQKFPVNGFKWVKKLSKFNEHFIKDYDENSNMDFFSKYVLNIRKSYLIFIVIYHFYPKEIKFKNVRSLFVTKKTMLFT